MPVIHSLYSEAGTVTIDYATCTRCGDCVEACPTDARVLGDLKNPKDPIHEFLRTHKVQVLKPQMATGSKAYYNGLDGSVR